MEMQVDDHYRIRIPMQIRDSFSDNFAYFLLLDDKKQASVMPIVYLDATAKEYERTHGEHIMANVETGFFFRTFFSGLDLAEIEKNHLVVVPERTRGELGLARNNIIEARVVGQRMIITPASQETSSC